MAAILRRYAGAMRHATALARRALGGVDLGVATHAAARENSMQCERKHTSVHLPRVLLFNYWNNRPRAYLIVTLIWPEGFLCLMTINKELH